MAIPIQWRTRNQRYSMLGKVCPHCSSVIFPPRGACPYCSREHVDLYSRVSAYRNEIDNEIEHAAFVMPAVLEPLAVGAAGDD